MQRNLPLDRSDFKLNVVRPPPVEYLKVILLEMLTFCVQNKGF